jgi:hypothetical protein
MWTQMAMELQIVTISALASLITMSRPKIVLVQKRAMTRMAMESWTHSIFAPSIQARLQVGRAVAVWLISIATTMASLIVLMDVRMILTKQRQGSAAVI